jgi:hypothetical protein
MAPARDRFVSWLARRMRAPEAVIARRPSAGLHDRMADDLPTVEARAALFDELAILIERRGIEPFVAAPLLEADDRFFPDEWHANDASIGRLAKRLLDYAGLGSYDVAVELASTTDEAPAAAVWLAGIDGTTCRFGTALTRLDDPLLAVATMAHEVARAYRRIHQLDDASPDAATELVSLTTIYLGFGIITTNASYRYRARGELRGSLAYTEWSHQRFGGLSPQAMSFLLAVQLAARDAPSSQVRSVAGQLEPNQRVYFEDAYRELMPDAVSARLRLPDRATWPAQRPLPPKVEGKLVRSLVGAAGVLSRDLAPATVVKGRTRHANAGRSTFRVIGTAAAAWSGLGFLIAIGVFFAAAAIASRFVSGPPLAWVPYQPIVALLVGGPILGFVLGKLRRRDRCSDPSCNARLPHAATTCPGCGGTLAATLKSRNERLDAEERLRLNRDDYDIDVGTAPAKLAPGARPLFTPAGVAGGLIGADVHRDDDEDRERSKSSG